MVRERCRLDVIDTLSGVHHVNQTSACILDHGFSLRLVLVPRDDVRKIWFPAQREVEYFGCRILWARTATEMRDCLGCPLYGCVEGHACPGIVDLIPIWPSMTKDSAP